MENKNDAKQEKRSLFFRGATIETREDQESGKRTVSGKIPYNSLSEDLGGFREVILPGAFTRSLEKDGIPVLWNHESRYVCGRSGNGTAEFTDTEGGLEFRAELPDTSWAHDMWESVSRGDVRGVSFGFYIVDENWKDARSECPTRELVDVELVEVSAGVTFPAYPESQCAARNKNAYIGREETTPPDTGRAARERALALVDIQ